MDSILHDVVIPALVAALGAIVGGLLLLAKEWLRQKVKGTFNQRVSMIIWEGIMAIWPKFVEKFPDGTFDDKEREMFKKEVRVIVEPRLKELRGFSKDHLGQWLSDQMDILLGKFMLMLGAGDPASVELEDPSEEELANAVATETIGFKPEASED